jgi:hypothetical protein
VTEREREREREREKREISGDINNKINNKIENISTKENTPLQICTVRVNIIRIFSVIKILSHI